MSRRFDIELASPSVHLGRLGRGADPVHRNPYGPDPSCPISQTSPLRHVALMRRTLLVLKYMEPPGAPPRDGEQYAGVFVTDGDVEEVFAHSEPPSHDDWVRERIPDPIERRYVNVSFRRIKEKVKEFISPSSDPSRQSVSGIFGQPRGPLGNAAAGTRGIGKGKVNAHLLPGMCWR
jgi:hypothetical protein